MGGSAGGQILSSGGLAGQGGIRPAVMPTTGTGPNPFQQASSAQSGALATTGAATQYQTSPTAQGGFERAIGYTPQQVAATGYQAAQQTTPITAASQMQNYQNPYETQVVQQTLRDIGAQAQMGQENLDAQAQRAKAFGGSRHGVAQAEALKGYTQQMADAAARMRQQGFQTQLGAGQFDVGQQTAAEARNVAAENVARQFGAQTGMTAQQLNQSAGLQGANLNLRGSQALSAQDLASAQMRLGAANQLSGLGQRSFGYGTGIQDRMAAQGAQQRGMQQAIIDAARGQYGQYTGAPAQGLNTMLGAITGAGVPGTAGTNTSFNPGLFNYLQVASQFPR